MSEVPGEEGESRLGRVPGERHGEAAGAAWEGLLLGGRVGRTHQCSDGSRVFRVQHLDFGPDPRLPLTPSRRSRPGTAVGCEGCCSAVSAEKDLVLFRGKKIQEQLSSEWGEGEGALGHLVVAGKGRKHQAVRRLGRGHGPAPWGDGAAPSWRVRAAAAACHWALLGFPVLGPGEAAEPGYASETPGKCLFDREQQAEQTESGFFSVALRGLGRVMGAPGPCAGLTGDHWSSQLPGMPDKAHKELG